MIYRTLRALIFVCYGVICSGDGCNWEVVLDPQGAVTTKGSKVKFACSISQCVTTNYPDTKFQMAHNGTEFGEATKTHESKDDNSFAFFEKQFNSPRDAGTYTCKVTSDGPDPAQTDVNVEFLHAEDKPAIVRLNNGTNTISCLRDSSDSQNLVTAWDDRRTSCDRSENTKTVALKSLKEVNRYRECYVTSTQACKHYGNVANAITKHAGVIYRKFILVLDINQERTGNLVNVTAFVFGPGANTVETSWEIDGTKISSHQKNVSENETIISVIVNGTIGELQLVHRLGVSELGRENVLLKEKQGPEDATQHGAGTTVGIVLGILVVIVPVIFFIVYSQRKKQYCFRKTAQTNGPLMSREGEPLHPLASTENGENA